MIYLDTSILVSLLVKEAQSAGVSAWFARLSQEEITISEWTCAEFSSAIGMKVRTGELTTELACETLRTFRALAENSLKVLVPDRADYLLSSRYLEQFDLGLRAGEALHLAIAADHGARVIYTLDRRLVEISRKLKIKARVPV